MGGWRFTAGLAALGLSLCACDGKPAGGPGGSGPRKEVETASNPGGPDGGRPVRENPAPLVDPTGSVQVYKGMKHEIGCENNLRNIGQSLMVYAAARGEYPPAGEMFKALIESNTLTTVEIYAVPKAKVTRDQVISGLGVGVYRTTRDSLNDATAADKPIAWDPEPWQDGRHVLFFDGTVSLMSEKAFGEAWGRHEVRK